MEAQAGVRLTERRGAVAVTFLIVTQAGSRWDVRCPADGTRVEPAAPTDTMVPWLAAATVVMHACVGCPRTVAVAGEVVAPTIVMAVGAEARLDAAEALGYTGVLAVAALLDAPAAAAYADGAAEAAPDTAAAVAAADMEAGEAAVDMAERQLPGG